MNSLHSPEAITSALLLIGAAGFVYSYFRAKTNQDNIRNAKDTIELQTDRIKALADKSQAQDEAILASQQKIIELETEIKIIRTLPLKQLSEDYHKVSDTLVAIKELLTNQEQMISFFYQNFQAGTLTPGAGSINIVQNPPKRRRNEAV